MRARRSAPQILLRFYLVEPAEDDVDRPPTGTAPNLFLVAHHIVCDAHSLFTISHTILRHYASGGGGGSSPRLAAPSRQAADTAFADYVAQQVEARASGRAEALVREWADTLTDGGRRPFRAAQLRADFPRSTSWEPQRSVSVPVALGSALTADIKCMAKAAGTTAFSVLLGAWQLLVHTHSASSPTDVTTGVSVDARGAAGASHASAVGCYSCLLPVCVDIAQAETFKDLLDLLARPVRRALSTPGVPFVGAR